MTIENTRHSIRQELYNELITSLYNTARYSAMRPGSLLKELRDEEERIFSIKTFPNREQAKEYVKAYHERSEDLNEEQRDELMKGATDPNATRYQVLRGNLTQLVDSYLSEHDKFEDAAKAATNYLGTYGPCDLWKPGRQKYGHGDSYIEIKEVEVADPDQLFEHHCQVCGTQFTNNHKKFTTCLSCLVVADAAEDECYGATSPDTYTFKQLANEYLRGQEDGRAEVAQYFEDYRAVIVEQNKVIDKCLTKLGEYFKTKPERSEGKGPRAKASEDDNPEEACWTCNKSCLNPQDIDSYQNFGLCDSCYKDKTFKDSGGERWSQADKLGKRNAEIECGYCGYIHQVVSCCREMPVKDNAPEQSEDRESNEKYFCIDCEDSDEVMCFMCHDANYSDFLNWKDDIKKLP